MKPITKNHSLTFFLVLLLSIHASSAQLFKTSLTSSLLSPSEKDIGNINKIAILDFENLSREEYKNAGVDIGSKMADYLSIALLKEYRGKNQNCFINGGRTDIYTIVEREELHKILEEKQLKLRGLSDPEIVAIGKELGVDAIILGNVSYSSTDERNYKNWRNDEGKLVHSHSLNRTTSVEVRMKILSIVTGEILGQTSERSSKSDHTSSGTKPYNNAVMSPEKLAEFACEQIGIQLANYIAPYYYSHTFTFENVKHKELKERVKDANKYLKIREIDKAYQMYNAIYQVDPYNPELVYNMGVLNEVSGNFNKAKELYSVAVNMDSENKAYANGLRRSEENIELTQILFDIGIEIIPHVLLDYSNTNILIERIKIKGPRSKRKIAYVSPSEDSTVIGEFPGGLELSLLDKTDKKWVLAKLPNNKEGYFKLKDVITGK